MDGLPIIDSFNSYATQIKSGTSLLTSKSSDEMPSNRSGGRNVHFYDARKPDEVLGGLILDQPSSVTEATVLAMLEILIVPSCPYEVRHRASAKVVSSDAIPLATGHYDIHCLAPDGRALVFSWLALFFLIR